MKVKLEQSFQTDIPVPNVWTYFCDPYKVVQCVPGAKITEQVDETTYKGTVSVKIGPVVNNFKGQVLIERLDNDSRELTISGKGSDAKGTGRAEMRMNARVGQLDDGKTEVAIEMELNISGKLAQLGARVIGDVNKQMFGLFTKNLEERLQSGNATSEDSPSTTNSASDGEPVKALPLLFTVIKNSIASLVRRLLGKTEA